MVFLKHSQGNTLSIKTIDLIANLFLVNYVYVNKLETELNYFFS